MQWAGMYDPPIMPQFFTLDMFATLARYKDKLGFECTCTWQDHPAYAIVGRLIAFSANLKSAHTPQDRLTVTRLSECASQVDCYGASSEAIRRSPRGTHSPQRRFLGSDFTDITRITSLGSSQCR
jgi:hypothetical protein